MPHAETNGDFHEHPDVLPLYPALERGHAPEAGLNGHTTHGWLTWIRSRIEDTIGGRVTRFMQKQFPDILLTPQERRLQQGKMGFEIDFAIAHDAYLQKHRAMLLARLLPMTDDELAAYPHPTGAATEQLGTEERSEAALAHAILRQRAMDRRRTVVDREESSDDDQTLRMPTDRAERRSRRMRRGR